MGRYVGKALETGISIGDRVGILQGVCCTVDVEKWIKKGFRNWASFSKGAQ
jgi:hypothetical protein